MFYAAKHVIIKPHIKVTSQMSRQYVALIKASIQVALPVQWHCGDKRSGS
ncbi:hypothetical protein IFVP69_C150108 [Vibrio parahaemolyticus]